MTEGFLFYLQILEQIFEEKMSIYIVVHFIEKIVIKYSISRNNKKHPLFV